MKVYACHAAAVVHRSMGWTHHEIGKVDVTRMDTTLQASRACGFTIPESPKRTQPSRDATDFMNPCFSSAVSPPLPVRGDSGNLSGSFSTSRENQQAGGISDVVGQPESSSFPDFCRVVVVGAGASGLSAAACLKRRGEHDVLLLER